VERVEIQRVEEEGDYHDSHNVDREKGVDRLFSLHSEGRKWVTLKMGFFEASTKDKRLSSKQLKCNVIKLTFTRKRSLQWNLG